MYGGCQCSSRPRAEERLAQVRLAAAVAEVPLPRRDDLERARAALVELHRVRDRLRLARPARPSRSAARRSAPAPASRSCPRARRSGRRASGPALPHSGGSATSRPSRPITLRVGSCSSRHHTTSVVSPKVQIIAMPEPFSGSASVVREHRHRHAEQRRRHRGAEPVPVALVVRVRDQRHARRDQLGARGLDDDVGRAVDAVERDRVIRAGQLAVLQLRLRDRGAVVDVPERRAPPAGTPRPGTGCAGTPAATPAASARRSSCTSSTSRPRARGSATAPRTSSRPRRRACSQRSTKLCRLIGIARFSGFSGGVNSGSYGSDGSQRTP